MALTAEDERPVLDKYEVGEEIGHGGMATVYRARDKRLDRDVAVKVIHRHLRENTEVAARFVSEARAVAKLKHPNIVEVYDVSDESDRERYLVVELVRGTTLRRLIHTHGHMPAEIAAAMSIEIAEGLAHAHEHGVIHRDVKPENVLVEPPGAAVSRKDSQERTADQHHARVKITDFGIAKLLDVQGVTSTGQVLGSPAHMAPEQIEGGDVTVRSDVFGMGVLMYECAVGKLPFDGKNPAQVLRRVLDGKYVPADRARPTVGSAFSRIIDRALAREAADRYPSIGDLIEALREELTRVGFDRPAHDLAEYLSDPAAYVSAYEPRIVERLVALGQAARKARDTSLAAACFNRALAFRPDDANLLRQVAGLARVQRLRRAGIRIAAIVTGSALLGAGAYGAVRIVKNAVPPPAKAAPSAAVKPVPPPTPSAAPSASETPEDVEARVHKTHATQPRPKPVVDAGRTRSVTIKVPFNGPAVIDGESHPLPFTADWPVLSKHTISITLPYQTCCDAPLDTFDVPDGTDPWTYQAVKLRDAQLIGPAVGVAHCNLMGVPRDVKAGEDVKIQVGYLQTFITCQVSDDGGSRDIKVKLLAGETAKISAQSD